MTKKITPADINERNAEFWKEQSQLFDERIAKRPHDLRHVIDKTHERIEDGAIRKVHSLEAQMAELVGLRDADQSVRASCPRKRQRKHREIVIDAMRVAQRGSQTQSDFLAAAAQGSIEGVKIELLGPNNGNKYLVTCDDLDNDAKFSLSTIGGWWTAAKS